MSRVKALIYTVLFAIVVLGLIFALALVHTVVCNLMVASIIGCLLGEKFFEFYKWLRGTK